MFIIIITQVKIIKMCYQMRDAGQLKLCFTILTIFEIIEKSSRHETNDHRIPDRSGDEFLCILLQ